jgi:hypothetical protein
VAVVERRGTAGRMSVHLCGAFCPRCHRRITTVALQGSPQLLSHSALIGEQRERCRGDYIAVPVPAEGRVQLIPVDGGRAAGERALREHTERWLALMELVGDAPAGVAA